MPAPLTTVALAFGLVLAESGEPTAAIIAGAAGAVWQLVVTYGRT